MSGRFVEVAPNVFVAPNHVVAITPGPPVRIRTVGGHDLAVFDQTASELARTLSGVLVARGPGGTGPYERIQTSPDLDAEGGPAWWLRQQLHDPTLPVAADCRMGIVTNLSHARIALWWTANGHVKSLWSGGDDHHSNLKEFYAHLLDMRVWERVQEWGSGQWYPPTGYLLGADGERIVDPFAEVAR